MHTRLRAKLVGRAIDARLRARVSGTSHMMLQAERNGLRLTGSHPAAPTKPPVARSLRKPSGQKSSRSWSLKPLHA